MQLCLLYTVSFFSALFFQNPAVACSWHSEDNSGSVCVGSSESSKRLNKCAIQPVSLMSSNECSGLKLFKGGPGTTGGATYVAYVFHVLVIHSKSIGGFGGSKISPWCWGTAISGMFPFLKVLGAGTLLAGLFRNTFSRMSV